MDQRPLAVYTDRLGSRMEVIEPGGPETPFIFDFAMAPHLGSPPLHVHPRFTELFEVRSGNMDAWMSGSRLAIGPGQRLEVPPGTVHRAGNPGSEWVRVRITVRPGLRMRAYFRDLCAIDRTSRGLRRLIRLSMLTMNHPDENRFVGLPGAGIRIMAWLGRVARLRLPDNCEDLPQSERQRLVE